MACCPKCGKKMSKRKDTCKRCGYTVNPNVSPVNYYMYDTKSPNVVYPMSVSKNRPQENPFGAKVTKKNRCPKCARRLKESKRYCKCGYERPGYINQKGSRWFGLVLAILSILAIAVIPYYAMYDIAWNLDASEYAITVNSASLLGVIQNMVDIGANKIFGILPAFDFAGDMGFAYTLSVYVYILFGLVAAIQAFFAIFTRTKAAKRVRRALFLLGLGALLYSVSFTYSLNHVETIYEALANIPAGSFLSLGSIVIDMFSAGIAVVGLITSFILKRIAKKQAKLMAA